MDLNKLIQYSGQKFAFYFDLIFNPIRWNQFFRIYFYPDELVFF